MRPRSYDQRFPHLCFSSYITNLFEGKDYIIQAIIVVLTHKLTGMEQLFKGLTLKIF